MKKQLLIILIFVYSTGIEAQSWVYHPFPTDSAIWTNANGYWDVGPGTATLTMYAPTRYCMLSDDTIIGTSVYSKINYCGGTYRGGLRDDGIGKIYFIPKDSINELLIYDFTVLYGDTVTVWETMANSPNFTKHTYYPVGYGDSVLINGSYRKRLWIEGRYWIEGIGCSGGLFVEAWPNVSNWYVNLDCMSYEDTTLYPAYSLGSCSLTSGVDEIKKENELILYPNPTSGLFQIKTNQEINSIEVLDIFGRRIYYSETTQTEINISNFTNGIYFVRLIDSKGNNVAKRIVKQ